MKKKSFVNSSVYGLLAAILISGLITTAQAMQPAQPQTIAVWLFDEQEGLYPSKVLHDLGPNEYPLSLGRAGYIVKGKFGHALEIGDPMEVDFPPAEILAEKFGLMDYEIPEGRTVKPLNWQRATFAAMMTSGERHLRRQVGFPQATMTGLNLGSVYDWTVEFWFQPTRNSQGEGTVFEIGQGPRGENDKVTRLTMNPADGSFTFYNQPGGVKLHIPSDANALNHRRGNWNHMAFVYHAADAQLHHYVNGVLQPLPERAVFRQLGRGYEDYFTVGTDGIFGRVLPGRLDELRFSNGKRYNGDFTPPESLASEYVEEPPEYLGLAGPPLLFAEDPPEGTVLDLGSRRHLFIDDALLSDSENITFTVNPPKVDDVVMRLEGLEDGIPGHWERFRKHLSVLEDEDGLIRLYTALDDEYLAVFLSRDGVHFEAPDLGTEHLGRRNIVVPETGGTFRVIIDPNAPPSRRWKYITGYQRRGVYVYTSPDGFNFTRQKQALLPFRAATQNDVIYDDQRQQYLGYWRSGFARTSVGNYTRREFVMSISDDIKPPMHFTPVSAEEQHREAQRRRLSEGIPWFLDNGPFTPGKFGMNFPSVFGPDDDIDGPSAGIYNPKAMKYPWAPDTYLAFPVFYFHYYEGYPGRQAMFTRRGGGPTETQFMSSRDGINWNRHPRPAYVGLGMFNGLDVWQNYISTGMIKRDHEIWQYVFVDNDLHTPVERTRKRQVHRLIQRLDGFVSIDSPYDRYATIITKPITFEGGSLKLNIDTGAMGYAHVALLDEDGNPIEGFSLEESVMINGDHTNIEVEWIKSGMQQLLAGDVNPREFLSELEVSSDVSSLEGRPVRVKIQMRGSKLYALQFGD